MPGTTANLQLPYPTPDDTVDVPRDVKALADKIDPLGVVPIGSFMMWPTGVAPLNWLLMQGQQIDAAMYPALANVLGSSAGKITIPDMRDVFPVGAGATMPLGQTGGASTIVLAKAHMPVHDHSPTANGRTGGSDRSLSHEHALVTTSVSYVAPSAGQFIANSFNPYETNPGYSAVASWYAINDPTTAFGWKAGASSTPDHLHALAAEGSGGAHENRPPFRAINFIIRAG